RVIPSSAKAFAAPGPTTGWSAPTPATRIAIAIALPSPLTRDLSRVCRGRYGEDIDPFIGGSPYRGPSDERHELGRRWDLPFGPYRYQLFKRRQPEAVPKACYLRKLLVACVVAAKVVAKP